ncbi:hypothetical protein RHMOL_Rhmol04G0088400 [Rhododendron molle]|uniref:Uncharacterized protein n=1 Tax=Rhododendron molle TaxID=49168 RepID=A0ACC0NZK8_RHOML|nr:hypothetical protein RHMOL_Rhmol04G0088400 [Rhododendron molle]
MPPPPAATGASLRVKGLRRSQPFATAKARPAQSQDDEEAFDILYCIAFAMMDAQGLVMHDSSFVAWEARKPLVIKEVEVAPPQKMESECLCFPKQDAIRRATADIRLKKKLFTLTWECSTCSNVEISGLDIGWGQMRLHKMDFHVRGSRDGVGELDACKGWKIPMKFDEERGLLILQGELLGQNPLFPGHAAPAVSEREKARNVETAQQIGKMK